MEDELREADINLVQDEPDIVLLGFDKTLTYQKLQKACYWIRKAKPTLRPIRTSIAPTEDGPIPDTGSMIELIAASTEKRPDVIIRKTVFSDY